MTKPGTSDDMRAVLLAEYAAMRGEVTTLLSLQGQFLNWSVVLLSVCIATGSNKDIGESLKPWASLAALPFLVLGLLYADVSARIMRAARYINLTLRPPLERLAGPSLTWETYLRNEPPGYRLTSTLDYLRWLFFLVPAGYFTLLGFELPQKWIWVPGFDVALILFCTGVLWYVFGDLARKVVTQ